LGKEKVDILGIPSFYGVEIGTIHSKMTIFRAIGNGFSVIRLVRSGVSMAIDPYGRILGYLDYFTTTDRTLATQVPIWGTTTI
jgi:apolipoprotein N-acyltransferase